MVLSIFNNIIENKKCFISFILIDEFVFQPVLVSCANKKMNMNIWKPEVFVKEFGHVENEVVNCRTGNTIIGHTMGDFWEGFENLKSKYLIILFSNICKRIIFWGSLSINFSLIKKMCIETFINCYINFFIRSSS